MDKWTRRAAAAVALLAIPAIFDYSVTRVLDQTLLYRICGLLCVIAIIVGVRVHRPAHPLAWYLIAAGNLMFVVGDIVYQFQSTEGLPPFPGITDVFYLGGYPFIAGGLLGLVGTSRRTRGSFIDASIIATSAGLLAWIFLMEPYATDLSLTLPERLTSIAYPLGDLLLLATVCWFFFTEGWKNTSLNLLLVSTAALLVFDSMYGVILLEGSYSAGWTDAGFILSYLTFGAAALHPSMKAFVSKNRDGLPTVSRGRLVLLAIAAILGPGLLALTSFRNTEVNHLVMASGMFLLFLLTFLRIAGLMRSIERNSTLLQVQGLELSTAVEGLKHAEAARRNLLDAVHSTAERERSSLAVDLHDGPIQHLTTLTLEADLATVGLNDGDRALAQKALLALEEGLSAEVESLRVLMTDLRPPVLDERGLAQALSDHVAAFAIRTKIVCDVDLDIERRLDRETETILYRIAQEALINVAKHSGAGHMFLRCQASDLEIMMEINDDGMGFDPLKTDMSGRDGHLGLASIRERVEFAGGTCSVDSAIGRGTRIALTLNLERNDDAQVAHIAG